MINLGFSTIYMQKKRKIMLQNEALIREINMHSKQSQELIETNKKLTADNLQLKRELDLTLSGKEELLKKTHAQNQTIKTLVSKFKKLEFAHSGAEEKG